MVASSMNSSLKMIYYRSLSWRKEGPFSGGSPLESPITENIMKRPDHSVNHMIRGKFTSSRFLSVIGNTTLVTSNLKNNFSKSVAMESFRWTPRPVELLNARNWISTVNNRKGLISLFLVQNHSRSRSRPDLLWTKLETPKHANHFDAGSLGIDSWILSNVSKLP